MTFDDVMAAMMRDAKACNKRASAIFNPKVALEANICPVCGKSFPFKGGKDRVTCSEECYLVSRNRKRAQMLRERRIDELLREKGK